MAPYQSINEALRKLQRREEQRNPQTKRHTEQSISTTPTTNPQSNTSNTSNTHSALLLLPAELREQIWIHTVTSWAPSPSSPGDLEKQPIRVDNLNRPLPPAITRVNRQCCLETLHLYYIHNTFECWRPMLFSPLWASHSTLMSWLQTLGHEKAAWLTSITLLYKREEELDIDLPSALKAEGYEFRDGVLGCRRERSEYELCYEQLGLPARFGERRGCRWVMRAPGS